MAAGVQMPEVWGSRRALPLREAIVGRPAVPPLPGQRFAHRGHRHAGQPHATVDVVLGRVPRDDADAGAVIPSIPAPARYWSLRDGIPDASQAACRDGASRARRYRRAISGRGGRELSWAAGRGARGAASTTRRSSWGLSRYVAVVQGRIAPPMAGRSPSKGSLSSE